ncbi:chloride channel protein [Methanomethylovorans sp.]|uniref:chloride channel protein n=1 Tax=Methanomethylovorans sp. TaxID=2758717 RepID=UPI00351C6A0E
MEHWHLNELLQHQKQNLMQWFNNESVFSNSLAVIVGVLTGIAIVLYDYALKLSSQLFFEPTSDIQHYYVIFIPAIGGLLVGIISHRFMKKKRYSIENVIESTTLHGGKMQPRTVFLEVLSSVISLGSGASAGKEAPVVLAGAGIGSTLAQMLKMRGSRLKMLLGCGASGGIAAAFNAPLAGVVFSVEVILGELESATLVPIVISAVFATLVSNVIFGVRPIQISDYQLISPMHESVLYLILGLLAGLVSVILMRSLYKSRDFFNALNIHPITKPAVGGLCVGCIGYFYPQIFGVGYETISQVLENEIAFNILLILLLLKIVAFSLSLGSGGSGGSFVPALFIGSMLGGAYGFIVNSIFPGITSEPGAYALAGMGAVFTGISRAPLTAILVLFELTRNYGLVLPIMLACVLSNLVSSALHPESIFTESLRRRGFTIRKGKEVDIMESLKVSDAMKREVQTISVNKKVEALIALMQSSRHAGFPVLDQEGNLWGIVTLKDIRDKVKQGELDKTIGEIATSNLVFAYPDESLNTVLQRLATKDIGRLPVVSREDNRKILGIITRSDIVKLYDKTIVERMQYRSENGN